MNRKKWGHQGLLLECTSEYTPGKNYSSYGLEFKRVWLSWFSEHLLKIDSADDVLSIQMSTWA